MSTSSSSCLVEDGPLLPPQAALGDVRSAGNGHVSPDRSRTGQAWPGGRVRSLRSIAGRMTWQALDRAGSVGERGALRWVRRMSAPQHRVQQRIGAPSGRGRSGPTRLRRRCVVRVVVSRRRRRDHLGARGGEIPTRRDDPSDAMRPRQHRDSRRDRRMSSSTSTSLVWPRSMTCLATCSRVCRAFVVTPAQGSTPLLGDDHRRLRRQRRIRSRHPPRRPPAGACHRRARPRRSVTPGIDGASTASLQATPMAEQLYTRLGFKPVSRLRERLPPTSTRSSVA